MRVAIFTETFLPKIDGIVTVVCLLLDHLAARGVEAVVVAPRMGVDRYRTTPVITVPGIPFPFYREIRIGPANLATYRQLQQFGPQVAHFFHPILIGTPGLLMARRLGIPTIASFHLDLSRAARYYGLGIISPLSRLATRIVFNAADARLAPSRLMQQELTALGLRDVGLWRRGVDSERFHPRFRCHDMRRQLSDDHPDDTLLLYVGRVSHEKQLDHLKPVLERVPHTRLAIIGDGPARAALGARFSGLPVKFAGYLQGEALSAAYASADCFVFPSSHETFGLVVTEALASGTPVVAYRVGGVADVVEDGVTGFSYAVGDIEGLVDGVRQIAADPDRRAVMGRAARALAETLSWSSVMDDMIALYAHLIRERAARV